MKVLVAIILFISTIAWSALITLYIVEQQNVDTVNFDTYWDGVVSNSKGRYQLLVDDITTTNSEPVPDKEGVLSQRPIITRVCFKFDTATGEAWRYIDDFTYSLEEMSTTRGFQKVAEDLDIYITTSLKKEITEPSSLNEIMTGKKPPQLIDLGPAQTGKKPRLVPDFDDNTPKKGRFSHLVEDTKKSR